MAFVFGVLIFALPSFSQVDYEFWFAAPYGNTDHAPYWPEEYPYKVGGRPIYLRLATQDADADVTITLPALGLTIANVQIAANSTESVDLTPYINDIQCSKGGNVVEDKGIYIRSNALITAYYEIASVLNTDIFSLKGQNALGKEFYAPFQNKMENDPYHNGEGVPDNGVSGDGAYSYIVIVATQDNTVVNVTPTTACVGIAQGATKAVRLDRGQTYVVRAIGQNASSRLAGTYIKSTKPVAVTIGEDSAYPGYYTNSGDCEDYIGDQIVPVDVIGKDYIIAQGQGYVAANNKTSDFYEIVAITATKDNTIVTLDGAQYGSALKKGETVSIELTDPNDLYTFIHTSEPAYAFHVSGYHCEVAGALLPSVEMCTGSYKMGFVRTYGSQNDQEFYMNLMVKGDGEDDFLLNGESNSVINNANFEKIDGTDWKVARIYFSRSEMPEGAYFLQNTTSLFHMGMMNSTSHDWGDGKGYRLMGSMYGYFSRFSDNYPDAVIVNNNDTSITVTRGTKVSLLADGGFKFSWKGYMWNGYDWELMEAPYKLNDVNVENPFLIVDAVGIYKYTATITTACYGDVDQSVLIKVVEPIDLNTVYDTVCYTPELEPRIDQSQYYNLFNLNDTIVGKKGLVTGFYVDHFDRYVAPETVIVDDYDDNRPMKFSMSVGNASRSLVDNPDTTGIVGDSKVMHIVKTKQDNGSASDAGLNNQTGQYSAWVTYNYASEPLNLEYGSKFSFDVRYDSTVFNGWGCDKIFNVYIDIVDDSKNVASIPCTSYPALCSNDANGYQYEWEHVEADFDAYKESMGPITAVRIRMTYEQWVKDYGFYVDNLTYYTLGHYETILNSEAKKYTITDGDSLYAIVKNNFEVTRSDTSMVYLTVRNPGIEKRAIQLADTCASNGNVLEEFNLTEYNYQTGGALVADRLWYWDSQRTKPIDNPEYVDVEAGTTTFYVYVDDECADIPGKLTLQVYAVPEVQDAETSVCEIPALGGDRGLVDLSQMENLITTDKSATFEWYSDANYTKLVGTLANIAVTDGTKYYAKVYNKITCPSLATLTINVIPVDDIVFEGFEICADADVTTLAATPAGGMYVGDGVKGNQFDPAAAGTGSHEITYTIENLGCTNSEKATIVVNPQVTVEAISVPKKIQQGQTAQIQTTITPASSDYKITWDDASLLTDPTSANPTTVALNKPTYYNVLVENTKTGCSATSKVLVDVYAPVDVELDLTPVCAGADVEIEALRTGGTGPFTYVWSLSPATDYTMVNDSVISIKNIQSTVDVTVTVTDKTEGDIKTVTKTQVVYPNPTVSIEDAEVCQYADLQLKPTVANGTIPYTYEWSGDTDILTTATNLQNATVNTSDNVGQYYLQYKVTDANSCVAKKDVSVIVNQQPKVAALADKEISCVDDIIQLQGTVVTGSTSGAVTHEWISSYASSLSSTSIPNPTLQSYIAGVLTFKYKFTDAKGCSAISDEVSIQNNPNPTISIEPVDAQCASNQGVMLSANAKVEGVASATFTYLWSGDIDSKESNPLLDISIAGTKTVNLKVTSDKGCEATTSTTVTVNPNPLAEIATKDLVACSSDTITMIANASSANVDYAWSGALNWLTDNASTVKVVIPDNINGASEIDYPVTLTVTDKTTHCSSEATTTVLANKIPQVSLGGDFELCDGSEVELKPLLNYVGTESYSLTWFLDVTQLSSVNVENPIYTQKGTDVYKIGVQVKDANGCVGKDNISITGLENPTVDAGLDREEDWDEPFTLTGTATGGHPTYSYLWSPKDSLTTAETLQNPTAKLRQTTKFTLEVTDSKGCVGTDDVTITIVGQPLSVMIEQKPMPFCFGNTVTLEAIPSGGNKGGSYKYEWYDMTNPTTVIGTTKTIEVSPSTQTTYKVVLNSVGPRDFIPADTIHTVVVNPLPSISLRTGLNPHVCKGDLTNLVPTVSGGSEPYTYQWLDGNPIITKTETYQFSNSSVVGVQKIKLIVTDAIGCSDSVEVAVMVDELPELQLDPVTECVNVEATAIATASNGKAPYSYFWSGDIQNMASSSNKATFTIAEQGTYTLHVSVEDDNSCKSETETIVTIKPEATLAFEKAYSVCASEDLELVLNPNNIAGFFTMHWVGGDKNRIVDSTKINRLMSTFRSENEGEYTLYYTIADEYNCPRLDSTKITVFPAVKLADIADMDVCAGVGVEIQAEIATGNPSSFTWLGSVSPKNEKKTTFTFSTPGTYNVTVIAGDQNCSDTKEFAVTVQPNPVVEIVGAPVKKVDYTEEVSLESKIVNYTTYPFTHVWKEAANIKSGAGTDRIVTTSIVQTTDFEYIITDAYGCTGSASIRLQTELIIPKITHFPKDYDGVPPTNELLDSTKYTLLEDALELCEGESAYLIPQFISGNNLESLTYSWKDDEGNDLGNDINVKIKPTKYSTIYTLTVSNPAGFSTDVSFVVIMHENPSAEIKVSPDYSGKYYTNDIFSVDGQPTPALDTYASFWSATPSVQFKDVTAQITTISGITQEIKPLVLTYKATNQYGCSVEVSKEINVVEQKIPVIVGPDVCINSTSKYRLDQTYPVGTKYVWTVEGGQIESKSADESSITVLWTSSENTTVTVSIYPPDGKERVIEGISHVAHITPMPDISINGQIHVCAGENAAYEAINNIPSMKNIQYGWNIADDHGDLVDLSVPNSEVATINWDKEGKDTVILRAMYGSCIIKEELTVYIHPTPDADFTYAASEDVFFVEEGVVRHTDSIFVDKDVKFTNLTTHKAGYEYYWDFIGDGVYTENSRDAIYEYDEVGDFMVSLMVVENTWGCKNVVAKPLKVVANPNCGMTFPNAFTPDLSENNTFYPVFKTGVMESGYELRIYNRWGTLLWSTDDLYAEWDGVYKGSVSKQDVYVYHCKATCEDIDPETGKHRILNVKGDVTIMR